MNIFITNHCPRKCSFCFARSRIGLSTEQETADIMTRENVRQVMDFLERSEEYQLRLLGGEPVKAQCREQADDAVRDPLTRLCE